MSDITKEAIKMLEILPEQDQYLAYELIKKLVMAWNPDYIKLTTDESSGLIQSENEPENN